MNSARLQDANIAEADNEVDPAVSTVVTEDDPGIPASGDTAGGVRGASVGSDDATPPNELDSTLAATLAGMVRNGEPIPGFADEDNLMSGDEEGGTLNVRAVDEALRRTYPREKQRATMKVPQRPPKPDTESESDTDAALTVQSRKRRRSGSSASAGKGKAKKIRSVSKARQPRNDVDLVSSGSEEEELKNSTSRHQSVLVSQIYKDWNGPLLQATRRRFQTLMMARDGFPLKSQTGHRHLNYKLVIRAAREIMPSKEFTMFHSQMERAFRDTEKS